MSLEQELKQLPDKSGVYIFYDKTGQVIYVGKAKSLIKRVPAHFRGIAKGRILSPIGQATDDFEVIVTATEAEALMLENNLIKQYKPRFNVQFRDDKSFPFVRITLAEEYPRMEKTRKIVDDGSRYIGPYANVKALDGLLRSVIRTVPIATCRRVIIPGKRKRPCLKYDIGQCPAPCVGKITKEEYAALVDQFILMLTGQHNELEAQLKQLMEESSRRREYERAARFRDRLRAVQQGRQAQRATMWNKLPGHRDVLGLARKGGDALVQLLVVRSGRIVGQQPFPLSAPSAQSDAAVLEAFIKQYYIRATEIPDEILIPEPIADKAFLARWLSERRASGKAVRIIHPVSGPRLDLVDMANENARFHLHQLVERIALDELRRQHSFAELVAHLHLQKEPCHIEGFDISTLQGTAPVGVCVVFKDGVPVKKLYRRFKIRDATRQDDFAMIREVVERRYRRVLAKNEPVPDLILVDGGRGQLNMALAALKAVEAPEIPVVGLAKGDKPDQDHVYAPWQQSPITLPKDGEGLRLLQRVRDEAHRYAINYHRLVRRRKGLELVITEIPDVGMRRATLLLKRFGSLEALGKASLEEVAAVPTISWTLAQRILDYLAADSEN
ncbi:MAG: excinuclease ABC subunit UvrC [Promethearchaeota archaeon]